MKDPAVINEIGNRLGQWLRTVYPEDGAKLAAIDFAASPHTTRRWFEGALPENRHFVAMAKKWGKAFVAFVLEPAVGPWGECALEQQILELRASIDRIALAWGALGSANDSAPPRRIGSVSARRADESALRAAGGRQIAALAPGGAAIRARRDRLVAR